MLIPRPSRWAAIVDGLWLVFLVSAPSGRAAGVLGGRRGRPYRPGSALGVVFPPGWIAVGRWVVVGVRIAGPRLRVALVEDRVDRYEAAGGAVVFARAKVREPGVVFGSADEALVE